MEEMRRVAFECALRACGFGCLGIFCMMIGLSFEPRLAFQAGGLLTLVMAVALILKSFQARTQDYRRTEMWLYLPKQSRPPKDCAQLITANVLRDTYLTCALWTSAAAIVMWLMALIFVMA
jgi:hypothetical protein